MEWHPLRHIYSYFSTSESPEVKCSARSFSWWVHRMQKWLLYRSSAWWRRPEGVFRLFPYASRAVSWVWSSLGLLADELLPAFCSPTRHICLQILSSAACKERETITRFLDNFFRIKVFWIVVERNCGLDAAIQHRQLWPRIRSLHMTLLARFVNIKTC